MSSWREVLIRILALLQRKMLIEWNKKSHIKMLKMALFDRAINEKCCSVDGGRGICPLFSSPPRGIWQLKSPHPQEFAIQGKKNANAWGSAPPGGGGGLCAGGIDWCIDPSTTTVYARSEFYPGLRFTLSLQSAFYTQSALYPWSAVCSLRFTLTN